MHVLILSQYFWPENFRINDLAVSLSEKECRVTVLTGHPNYPEGRFFKGYGGWGKNKERYNEVIIRRVPIVPRGKGGPLMLILNYLSFVLSASLLGPFLCREKYDLIFVYEPSPITVGIPAIVLKKLKHLPIFFWVQDLWPETLSAVGVVKSRRLLDLVGKMVGEIYAQCDRILIQSKTFRSSIEKYSSEPEKILYFPNSAEGLYECLLPDYESSFGQLMPSGFKVMFAGNIGAAQGFGTILDAAELLKNHKDIHWVILGDGRMRSHVEEDVKIRGLDSTFHLLGRYPLETMPQFFAFADTLLVSLKEDPIFSLTIPGKLQSYLACGKPVIAALDGAGADVVRESGSGFVCSPENAAELSETVLKMYSCSKEERKRMGVRGRSYFESHFEPTMLVQKLVQWMHADVNRTS